MSKRKYFIILIIFMISLSLSQLLLAEKLKVEVQEDILEPLSETNVRVSLIDDNGNVIKENRRLLVKVNKGGLLEIGQVKKGIQLKEGKAEFTYIAADSIGQAELTLLDLKGNLSEKIVFNIKPVIIDGEWENQFITLSDIEGEVLVKLSGKSYWDTAKSNNSLKENDMIRTWEDSWVTLNLFDESTIVMEPMSELIIKNISSMKNDAKVKQGVFELIKGNLLCSAKDFINRGSRFTIETESATAGVRGTYFEVRLTDDGEVVVLAYKGSIYVEHKEAELVFVVNKGEKIIVPKSKEKIVELVEILKHNLTEEDRIEQLNKDIQDLIEDIIYNAPEINVLGETSIVEGNEASLIITITYIDLDQIDISVSNLPEGAKFDERTGIISWDTTGAEVGTYDITITANDGITIVQKLVRINVLEKTSNVVITPVW